MEVSVSFNLRKEYSGGYDNFEQLALDRHNEWLKSNPKATSDNDTEEKSDYYIEEKIEDCLKLPYKSAREFRILDCIYSSFFITGDEKELMMFLLAGYVLVLTNRSWFEANKLNLTFEVVKEDMEREFVSDVTGSRIYI